MALKLKGMWVVCGVLSATPQTQAREWRVRAMYAVMEAIRDGSSHWSAYKSHLCKEEGSKAAFCIVSQDVKRDMRAMQHDL
jgi:hypothetical protein